MKQAFLVAGLRSPFGSFGGSLRDIMPDELGALLVKELLKRHSLPAEEISSLVFGNVMATSPQSIYLARHIALKAGLPPSLPALSVNRLCGSGLEAVVQAAREIALGESDAVLAGGVEMMSQAPFLADGMRWGSKLGSRALRDALLEGLTDSFVDLPMGMTAENLARDYNISRADQDKWAALSQTRAEKAKERLAAEILPISARKTVLDHDEYVKGMAGVTGLAELRPAFDKEGTVTAGNASGINDGGSCVLVSSEEVLKRHNLKPLARIVSYASVGCDPARMGIGPAVAIPSALSRAGLKQSEIDLFEVNEAFAAQLLAVKAALQLDADKLNVNGGAIAIGHPLGASGNRILLSLALELGRREARYGVASLCIGGGQGIAMVLERV